MNPVFTLFGAFYPECEHCRKAPAIDGWCEHPEAPTDDKIISHAYMANGRPYCGQLVDEVKCPIGSTREKYVR